MNAVSVEQKLAQTVEELLESDDAFGSDISILSYGVKNGTVQGKFRDNWSGRVFEFSIKDRIGYRPAIAADKLDHWDSFSAGYAGRLDRGFTGKKPKCGATAYNCGATCISLKKNCWIDPSGRKTKKGAGAIASYSQIRIQKLKELAKAVEERRLGKGRYVGSAQSLRAIAEKAEGLRGAKFKLGVKNSPPKLPIPSKPAKSRMILAIEDQLIRSLKTPLTMAQIQKKLAFPSKVYGNGDSNPANGVVKGLLAEGRLVKTGPKNDPLYKLV